MQLVALSPKRCALCRQCQVSPSLVGGTPRALEVLSAAGAAEGRTGGVEGMRTKLSVCCAVRTRTVRGFERYDVCVVWSRDRGQGGREPAHEGLHGHTRIRRKWGPGLERRFRGLTCGDRGGTTWRAFL